MEAKDQSNRSAGTELLELPSDHLITSTQVWGQVGDVMSKNVATISPDETLLTAAKIMAVKNVSSVIVFENSVIVGILTETDLVNKVATENSPSEGMKVSQIMSAPVEFIPPDLSPLEASTVMETKHIKRLPIVDDGKLVGIVTQTDLVQVLTSYGMWKNVGDIMSTDVALIPRTTPVAEAARTMTSRKISCVVIIDADEVVGVFTERDLLKRVVALQKNPADTKMEEVMSASVVSVPANFSIISARKTMENSHIRRLLIMEDGNLLGIVTQTDIFMAMKDKLQTEEQKNLDLLEKSKSNIYTMDLNGKITYINPAFMKLLDISDRAELIGKPFLPSRFWIDPERGELLLERLKNCGIETEELYLKTTKGKRVYAALFSTLTKGIHGRVDGIQGVIHDITKRKMTEKKLRKEVIKRKQVEDKLKKYKPESKVFPKIVKRWNKTEDAYRKAAHAWRQEKSLDTVKKHLRDAVNEALAALKLAGDPYSKFTEVQDLLKSLRSSKTGEKEALDQTRQVLNFLGGKIHPEAGLWHIEHRANDS
jgi:PAS domain S-box-containing protein